MKGFTQSDVDEYNARRAAKRAAKRGLIVDPFAALAKFDAVADPDAVADGEELVLHGEIIKELLRRGWHHVYHNPSKPTGATAGTPDFIIYCPAARMLHVECKTKKGKLSKDQVKFRDDITVLHHDYHVVRSLARFKAIADQHGWEETVFT